MSKAQQHRSGAGQAQKSRARRPQARDDAKRAEEQAARDAEREREAERFRQEERARRGALDEDPDDERFEDDERDERRGGRDTWIDERD